MTHISLDHQAILDFVTPSSSVLDLGCGSGDLLSLLVKEKQVKAQGIEIDDKAIFECVEKGLSVFHDDIDTGLPEYGDKSFDFVILNQSLQQVKKPAEVLRESRRVGRKVIVGIPNFTYIGARCQIFFQGQGAGYAVASLRMVQYAQPAFLEPSRFYRLLQEAEDRYRRDPLYEREGTGTLLAQSLCVDGDFSSFGVLTYEER